MGDPLDNPVNAVPVKSNSATVPVKRMMPEGAIPVASGGWIKPNPFKPGNPGNPNGGIAVQGWLHRLVSLDRPALESIADNPRAKSDKVIAAVQVLTARERGDLVDYEPWLRGEKSLTELKACGVGTYGVKRAKVTERADGTIVREIELHDRAGSAFDRFLDRTIGKAIQPSLVASVTVSPAHLAESVLADLRSLGMSPRLPLVLADVGDAELRAEAERRWGVPPLEMERSTGGAGERDSACLPGGSVVEYAESAGNLTVESHRRPDTRQANTPVSTTSVGYRSGVPSGTPSLVNEPLQLVNDPSVSKQVPSTNVVPSINEISTNTPVSALTNTARPIYSQHGQYTNRIGSEARSGETGIVGEVGVSASSTRIESGAATATGDLAKEAGAEPASGVSRDTGRDIVSRNGAGTASCDSTGNDGGLGRRVDPDPQAQGETYGASSGTDTTRTGNSCGASSGADASQGLGADASDAQGKRWTDPTATVAQEPPEGISGLPAGPDEEVSGEKINVIEEWPQPYQSAPKPPPTPEEIEAAKDKNREYMKKYMKWSRAAKTAKKKGLPRPRKRDFGL